MSEIFQTSERVGYLTEGIDWSQKKLMHLKTSEQDEGMKLHKLLYNPTFYDQSLGNFISVAFFAYWSCRTYFVSSSRRVHAKEMCLEVRDEKDPDQTVIKDVATLVAKQTGQEHGYSQKTGKCYQEEGQMSGQVANGNHYS